MPQPLIELEGNVPDAGFAEALIRRLDAFAHAADAVLVAGDEEGGRVWVHRVDIGLLFDKADPAEHIQEQPDRYVAAAKRVGDVTVNIFRVGTQPVIVGAVGGKGLVVGAEDQAIDRRGEPVIADPSADHFGKQPAALHQRRRLLTGAHDDRAGKRAGITDEIGARKEGAHGVTEQKTGQLRILSAGHVAQGIHVVHDMPPAVVPAEVKRHSAFGNGESVTEVVVGDDDKAVRIHKPGERLVAQRVLRHAVRDLQHADGSLRDAPLDRMDLRHAVGGGKIKFFSVFHSITSSFMI